MIHFARLHLLPGYFITAFMAKASSPSICPKRPSKYSFLHPASLLPQPDSSQYPQSLSSIPFFAGHRLSPPQSAGRTKGCNSSLCHNRFKKRHHGITIFFILFPWLYHRSQFSASFSPSCCPMKKSFISCCPGIPFFSVSSLMASTTSISFLAFIFAIL